MGVQTKNEFSLSWQWIIEICLIIFTSLGATISLYLHTDNKFHEGLTKQSERSDRLYEMFIDLLKENRGEK